MSQNIEEIIRRNGIEKSIEVSKEALVEGVHFLPVKDLGPIYIEVEIGRKTASEILHFFRKKGLIP